MPWDPYTRDQTKSPTGDFPGGPVVKNLLSKAGEAGLIPGRETKIPHAIGQLSLRATIRESVHHKWNPVWRNKSPARRN